MNKPLKVLTALALTATLTITTMGTTSASSNKVMWGKTELKIGQIGKVTILNDTKLYYLDGDTLKFYGDVKKGDEFRVYQYKGQHGGLYGVGNGSFLKKGDINKLYETPSKSKLKLVNGDGPIGMKPNGERYATKETYRIEGIFKEVLDDNYEITIFDGSDYAKLNGKHTLCYDYDEELQYFFINDVSKISESYKIMKGIGFKLSESELKRLIKKADDSDKAYTEGSLYS